MTGQNDQDDIEKVRKIVADLSQNVARLEASVKELSDDHKQRQVVKRLFGWLIDKTPTLGAICMFFYWVMSEASKKVGGNGN